MAEATPARVTHVLPAMTFRGIEAPPYDGGGFRFRHSQAPRNFPGLSRAAHDWQGMESEQLQFTLYFLNNLGRGTLFPGLWNKWWPALRDGLPGPMLHPLLGEIDVVPLEGSVELKAQVTNGVIVEAQFEPTLLDPEAVAQDFVVRTQVKDLAKIADEKCAEADIFIPSGVVETSLFDLVAQLDGFLFAIENQALGIVNRVKGVIEGMVDFIDSRDPRQTVQQARDALVKLWGAVDDLARAVGQKLRPIEFVSLTSDQSLDAFARERGMSLDEAIELNPLALLSPVIPKGTTMQFYA